MSFRVREVAISEAAIRSELGGGVGETDLRPVVLKVSGAAPGELAQVLSSEQHPKLVMVTIRDGVLVGGTVQHCRELALTLEREAPQLAGAIRAALYVSRPARLVARGRGLPLGGRTLVMGILNVSPDSFSGDGLPDAESAAARARRFLEAGADILDVGAMSTRPRSDAIPEELEAERLGETIRALRELTDIPISADTYRLRPAREALEAGADILNDVTGLRDPRMAELAAGFGAGVVVMHMLGTPDTMQSDPRYEDVTGEVYEYLGAGVERAVAAGVGRDAIAVDPGIGFGKTLEHNLELLHRLRELAGLGCPILVGTSRKSFIGRVTGREVHDRLEGTAATVALAIANGADIVRVHDVGRMATVARMSDAVARWPGTPVGAGA